MTSLAIIGGLGAALCWGVGTLVSRTSSRQIGALPTLGWVMISGLVVLAVPLIASKPPEHAGPEAWVWLLIAGAGNVVGLFFAYQAYRKGALALVAPVVATEGAVAAVFAIAAGATVSVKAAVGLVLVVVGTVLSRLDLKRPCSTAARDSLTEPCCVSGRDLHAEKRRQRGVRFVRVDHGVWVLLACCEREDADIRTEVEDCSEGVLALPFEAVHVREDDLGEGCTHAVLIRERYVDAPMKPDPRG